MSVTLQDIYNLFNDGRIDDSDDMLDQSAEGLRMINKALRTLRRISSMTSCATSKRPAL